MDRYVETAGKSECIYQYRLIKYGHVCRIDDGVHVIIRWNTYLVPYEPHIQVRYIFVPDTTL